MSEFIGSRISLISKSDIKYIGTLHEINSDSHTVALESVTSYGTEGRKGDPAAEIPGSDQVYEYIVFRGSDVKELTIVSGPSAANENKPPQVPNDPAILGSARPPASQNQPPQQQHFNAPPPGQQYGYPPNFQNQPRFQAPGGAHGFPGSPGAVPGYGGMGFAPPPPGYRGMGYPPPGPSFGASPGLFPPQNPMPPGPPGQQMNQRQQPPQSSSPQIPLGSQQGDPLPSDSQAPPPHSQSQQKPIEMSGTPVPNSAAGPPPPLDSKPTFAATTASNASKPATKAGNRVAVPLAPQKPAPRQPAAPEDATHAATAAVAAAMAKLGNVNPAKPQPSGQTQTQTDSLARQVNQMRLQDGQTRGRGGPRGRGAPRGGRRDGAPKIEVPKEDYDFESANAKFNKQDLVKEAIGTGSPVPDLPSESAATNGHSETEDVVIPPKPSVERGYDKKSSFFDNISSDLKDRAEQAEGVDGRALRREERNRNVETFGQGSVDGNHRGYRGRGRGGYGRGGRGYRGGHDNRGGGFRGRGRGGAETTTA